MLHLSCDTIVKFVRRLTVKLNAHLSIQLTSCYFESMKVSWLHMHTTTSQTHYKLSSVMLAWKIEYIKYIKYCVWWDVKPCSTQLEYSQLFTTHCAFCCKHLCKTGDRQASSLQLLHTYIHTYIIRVIAPSHTWNRATVHYKCQNIAYIVM